MKKERKILEKLIEGFFKHETKFSETIFLMKYYKIAFVFLMFLLK